MAGWRDKAACRDHDPELFWPITETGPAAQRQIERAKAVCGSCSVRKDCGEHAGSDGVWGGLSADERRNARRRSRAG